MKTFSGNGEVAISGKCQPASYSFFDVFGDMYSRCKGTVFDRLAVGRVQRSSGWMGIAIFKNAAARSCSNGNVSQLRYALSILNVPSWAAL